MSMYCLYVCQCRYVGDITCVNTDSVHIVCSTNCVLCTITSGDNPDDESPLSTDINNTAAEAAAAAAADDDDDDGDDEIMSTNEFHARDNESIPKVIEACLRADEPYSRASGPCSRDSQYHSSATEPYTSERLSRLRAGYKLLSSPSSAVKFDFNSPRVSDDLSVLASELTLELCFCVAQWPSG